MELKIKFKYILKFLIILFLFLSIIVLVRTNGFSKGIVTIEGLQNSILSPSEAFCESHRGSSGTLDKSCEKLTNGNCNSTSCCVWTSDKKCAAGNEKGPTFNTNANGQTNQLDYYYFKGKCYGNNCPN